MVVIISYNVLLTVTQIKRNCCPHCCPSKAFSTRFFIFRVLEIKVYFLGFGFLSKQSCHLHLLIHHHYLHHHLVYVTVMLESVGPQSVETASFAKPQFVQ